MARAVRTITNKAKALARPLKTKLGRRKASAAKEEAASDRPTKPRPRVRARKAAASTEVPPAETPAPAPPIPLEVGEEEQIESSKYLPRHVPPKRLFEEERFIFPETYGKNRVRLLVKDPEWLFAHWDVDRRVLEALSRDIGERTVALSRLTLKITDPAKGGTTVILLPPGVRGWYVRADNAPRSYRAELGLTLPSGEFRHLAASNTVTTPRVGSAPERARRRLHYRSTRRALAGDSSTRSEAATEGPWPSARMDGHEPAPQAPRPGRKGKRGKASRGGASDVYRR